CRLYVPPAVGTFTRPVAATLISRTPATMRSSPQRTLLPIDPAVLDRLGAVLCSQRVGASQIRDRPRDFQHPIVSAGREPETRDRSGEEPLGVRGDHAVTPDLARVHGGVDAEPG